MKIAGDKVKQIITQDFDMRLANAVITYILSEGISTLEKCTDEDVAKVKGNPLMTAEFVQAMVRTAIRICKECDVHDDIYPFIINHMYVHATPTKEIIIYQEEMTRWRWEQLINDLDVDYEENADEILSVTLNTNVIGVERKED